MPDPNSTECGVKMKTTAEQRKAITGQGYAFVDALCSDIASLLGLLADVRDSVLESANNCNREEAREYYLEQVDAIDAALAVARTRKENGQ